MICMQAFQTQVRSIVYEKTIIRLFLICIEEVIKYFQFN